MLSKEKGLLPKGTMSPAGVGVKFRASPQLVSVSHTEVFKSANDGLAQTYCLSEEQTNDNERVST